MGRMAHHRLGRMLSFGWVRGKAKNLTLEPSTTLAHAWIQVVAGSVKIEDHSLDNADGLAIEHIDQSVELTCAENSIFFLFRLTPT